MELYRKYPILCTLWAFFEVVCFGGVIFGWGSLVFILKEEGFYLSECQSSVQHDALKTTDGIHLSLSLQPSDSSGYHGNADGTTQRSAERVLNSTGYTVTNEAGTGGGNSGVAMVTVTAGCQAQEAKLNLWFSIAVSFMYLVFTLIGYLTRRIGARLTRCFFVVVYMIGTLNLAFASPEVPWLLLPGLCGIGTGGLVLLATNMWVANLHPRVRSTIVAIFTGLFDFSSINKQLIKVAFESGIPRRYSYIVVTVAFVIVVMISTVLFFPKGQVIQDPIKKRKKAEGPENTDEAVETSSALVENQTEDDLNGNAAKELRSSQESDSQTMSLCSTLTSLTCVLHLYWVFVHALRFVTFIGLLNTWLEDVLDGDEVRVSTYLGLFSYMTLGAIGTALLCGFLYDWQRTKYMGAGYMKRVYLPVILPMTLTIGYSVLTTVLCYIRVPLAPYLAFAVFTFFRSSLWTVAVAFFGEAFPVEYFGVLFGFIQFSAGVAGLLQYPLFEWYDAYEGSYAHVNILLLVLQLSTLIHPAILYVRARRANDEDKANPFNQEISVFETKPL